MRLVCTALLASLIAACASEPPKGPAPHVISLRPSAAGGDAKTTPLPPLRVVDRRDRKDLAQVGEVLAPGGGIVPPIGGSGSPALAGAVVAIMLLTPPQPTGQLVLVDDPADVTRAVESALILAWRKSGRDLRTGLGLELTVRNFWMTPSWTTRCDLSVDLRLHDAAGAPLWQATLESQAEEFVGFYVVESFERVATMALDRFVDQAAGAFVSPAFVAAATGP
jgi:hypothetical protein